MRTLDESGSASCQFDSPPGQSDPLHAAEQLQQHLNPFAWLHAGVKSEVPGKGTAKDPHPVACAQARRLRQIDQAAPLPPLELVNDGVGHMRRPITTGHQANHVWTPARGPPTVDDSDEQIARKQRRPGLDLTAASNPRHSKPGQIALIAGKAEEVLRRGLVLRHGLRRRPIRHGRSPPCPRSAAQSNAARIFDRDRRQAGKFGRTTVVPRRMRLDRITGRIEEPALERHQNSVG